MSSLNSSKTTADAAAKGVGERRVHHHLREIFDDACRITAPFFDPQQSWGNQSQTRYARQALCDAYPNLTQQDIAILFAAVARVQGIQNAERAANEYLGPA